MNWGTGIAIFYTLFVMAMIGAVVKSCHSETHLVQENYYAQDLAYEEFRQARSNAQELQDPIKIELIDREKLQIQFPQDMKSVKGEVQLFRPSNKYKDKIWPIALSEKNQMILALEDRSENSGKWIVKVRWENNAKDYYHEEVLVY